MFSATLFYMTWEFLNGEAIRVHENFPPSQVWVLPDLRGNIHSRPPPSSEFDIAEGGRDKTLSLLSSPDMQMGMGPNQTASNRLFVCVYPDANERWEKKFKEGPKGRKRGREGRRR